MNCAGGKLLTCTIDDLGFYLFLSPIKNTDPFPPVAGRLMAAAMFKSLLPVVARWHDKSWSSGVTTQENVSDFEFLVLYFFSIRKNNMKTLT